MYVNAHDHLSFYKNSEYSLNLIEVNKILTLACSMNIDEYVRIKDIAKKNKYIKVGFGIHPWEVKSDADFINLENYIKECDFIGEIGIDYFWAEDKSAYPKQKEIFKYFLEMSKKYDKVCNIHTKGAEKEVLSILESNNLRGQIIHWFSGELGLVKEYLQLDSYFTISSDIGYSKLTDSLIREVPLSNILTETDGPTSREWVNGQYAEPIFVKEILEYIAKIKGLEFEFVKEKVYENYLKLKI